MWVSKKRYDGVLSLLSTLCTLSYRHQKTIDGLTKCVVQDRKDILNLQKKPGSNK